MHKRSIILLSLILLILFCLVLPRSAAAQSNKTITGTPLSNVNIRSTPGINTGVLSVLPPGGQATAVGRTSGNNWIQIDYQGTRGWVAAWLLVFSADTITLTVTTDAQPDPLAVVSSTTLLAPYNLNIRKTNQPEAEILAVLPFNTSATVTARSADSSWVFVKYGNVQGWVAAWLAILGGDINGLPVSSSSGSGVAPGTPGTPAATPTPRGTPAPPAGTPGSPTGIIITAPLRVNIRSAPSTNGSVLVLVPGGAQMAALGRNAGHNWIQVQYGNTTGWVAKWVVNASDNTVALPVLSESTEVAPHPANQAVTATAHYAVSVRTGPSFNFGTLIEIPAGGTATLTARTADSAWVRVNYAGTEGWAASWVLTANADMNVLPIQEP
jgi:uncharacterized protein YraI